MPALDEVLYSASRLQVRDYLDLAALADRLGTPQAAEMLSEIDEFYADTTKEGQAVVTQLVRQLGEPRPRNLSTVAAFPPYKGLRAPWTSWSAVREQCRRVAADLLLDSAENDRAV